MRKLIPFGTFVALALASVHATAASIEMEVNGLVCAFCAQGIEKTLRKFDATEDVFVSLEHRMVALSLRDGGTIADAELTSAMTNAGYTVVGIRRTEESLDAIRERTAVPAR